MRTLLMFPQINTNKQCYLRSGHTILMWSIGPLHGHKGHNVHSSKAIFLEDIQNTDTVLSNRKIIVS